MILQGGALRGSLLRKLNYIRFDHQEQRERFYPGILDLTQSDPDAISHNGTPALGQITPDRTKSDASDTASDINLLLDLLRQLPKTSFALGAFVGGGFDILVALLHKNLSSQVRPMPIGFKHFFLWDRTRVWRSPRGD